MFLTVKSTYSENLSNWNIRNITSKQEHVYSILMIELLASYISSWFYQLKKLYYIEQK